MSVDSGAPSLLSAGYANVDLIARLPKSVQAADRRVTVQRIEVAPGGMAANTACVAASLGTPVTLFCTVGNDHDGRFLLDAWAACGVDTGQVLRNDARGTTKCLISVHPDGDRTIVSESMTFEYGPLQAALSQGRFPQGTLIYFDGYRLSDFGETADLARARGCAVAADLDGCEDAGALSLALPRLDIVFSNRSTLARLVGNLPLPRALAGIAGKGPRIVIGTSGKEGAWILSKGSVTHVPGDDVDVRGHHGRGGHVRRRLPSRVRPLPRRAVERPIRECRSRDFNVGTRGSRAHPDGCGDPAAPGRVMRRRTNGVVLSTFSSGESYGSEDCQGKVPGHHDMRQ